jgi:hypothetical protein
VDPARSTVGMSLGLTLAIPDCQVAGTRLYQEAILIQRVT